MGWKDVKPVSSELLDVAQQEQVSKIGGLIKSITEAHPYREVSGESGTTLCPFCDAEIVYYILRSRRLHLECPTQGCLLLRAGPLKSKPRPQGCVQGELLL